MNSNLITIQPASTFIDEKIKEYLMQREVYLKTIYGESWQVMLDWERASIEHSRISGYLDDIGPNEEIDVCITRNIEKATTDESWVIKWWETSEKIQEILAFTIQRQLPTSTVVWMNDSKTVIFPKGNLEQNLLTIGLYWCHWLLILTQQETWEFVCTLMHYDPTNLLGLVDSIKREKNIWSHGKVWKMVILAFPSENMDKEFKQYVEIVLRGNFPQNQIHYTMGGDSTISRDPLNPASWTIVVTGSLKGKPDVFFQWKKIHYEF